MAKEKANRKKNALVTNKERNQEKMLMLIAGEMQDCERKNHLIAQINVLCFQMPKKGFRPEVINMKYGNKYKFK